MIGAVVNFIRSIWLVFFYESSLNFLWREDDGWVEPRRLKCEALSLRQILPTFKDKLFGIMIWWHRSVNTFFKLYSYFYFITSMFTFKYWYLWFSECISFCNCCGFIHWPFLHSKFKAIRAFGEMIFKLMDENLKIKIYSKHKPTKPWNDIFLAAQQINGARIVFIRSIEIYICLLEICILVNLQAN